MSSTRAVLQVFEKYQKDRVTFVQTVAELATRPQNIEPMQAAGIMALLRPLLLDNVPRCSGCLCLGCRAQGVRVKAGQRTRTAWDNLAGRLGGR